MLLMVTPCAASGEWDAMAERQRAALTAAGVRVPALEATARGTANPEQIAEASIRDRIARARAALKRDAARPAPTPEESRERLLAATRDWGPNGASRAARRAASATIQKNLELADQSLASAIEAVQATAERLSRSGVREAVAAIETSVSETRDRLSARWQREHAARERERQQREREAGQRERGVR